jgi:ABC-2 type transport system ATP-binding protein
MGRVDEVLAAVGLSDAADRRVKGYSMGMRQRLAIAAALLGDPEVLILDEPTNGLDPPGISWMRRLLREQAANGRAVLVSSHLLAEVAQSVDDVVIIASGALEQRGHRVERDGDRLLVLQASPAEVGEIALEAQVALTGLAPRTRSLEAAFFALTGGEG